MRGLGARTAVAGLAVFGALMSVTLSGSPASAGPSAVHGYQTEFAGLRVQVYSQMCDRGGKNLHTRLNVRNNGSTAKSIMVHSPLGPTVYNPPGPIAPGKGMLAHLTMTRDAPEHSITLQADGQIVTMTVPESPCTTTTSTTKKPPNTSSTTKSTTSTSKPTTSSTINTIPVDPGGGTSGGGGVVSGPGVVAVGASVGNSGAVQAASTGTLPFTGSDIRAFALLGNLLVLIGFAMLFISHRSPKAAAFFKRLRPAANS